MGNLANDVLSAFLWPPYDREAVGFLVAIKELLEEPANLIFNFFE